MTNLRHTRRAALAACAALACGAALAGPLDDGAILRKLALDHFQANEAQAGILLKGAKDGPEHFGVYFWLAKESGKDLHSILRLRLEGKSWSVIFTTLRVDVNRIFIALPRPPGPPYGKAYGYWAHGPGSGKGPAGKSVFHPGSPRNDGRNIVLTDIEICDWINAAVLAGTLGLEPQVVLDRRSAGEPLAAIAGKTYREKHPAERERPRHEPPPRGDSKKKGRF